MISLTLKPIFLPLLLISSSFVASFDLNQQQAGELFPSFSGIAEPQQNEGNNGLELIASNNNPTLTTTGGKYSEFALFQSGTHRCSYNNPNQPPSRRSRSKRAEVCVPDDHNQPVQDNVQAQPEEKPQQSAQPPDVSPVYQEPLAPYKDKLLCPIPRAPWPVCGTVDSFYIHHQIIYPVMNAPIGWWIHEYCVPGNWSHKKVGFLIRLGLSAPRFPGLCNKLAREVVWCCGVVFPYSENPNGPTIEPYPALRLIYPNIGYGCVPMEAL